MTSVPRRTLLVGYGKLGARLAARLLADDGEVFALRRSTGSLPARVIGLSADPSHPLDSPLPVVDAMVITLPPSGVSSGYRTALTNLRAALPVLPARTVFVSSTGVFEGAAADHPLTEQDVPAPTSARSQELYDGEQAAVALFSAVIVRPAGIYGPGREFLLRKVREGAAVDHARRTNRIHEVDLVRTLDLLVRMEDPPPLLHAVDERPAPLAEVVAFIAGKLGVDVPPDAASGGRSGVVYDGTLLRSVLGRLEYPTFEAGYAEMIAEDSMPRP